MKNILIISSLLFIFASCQNNKEELEFLVAKNQKLSEFYQNSSEKLYWRVYDNTDTLRNFCKKYFKPIDDFYKINEDCKNLFPLIENINIEDNVDSVINIFMLKPENYAKNYPVYDKPEMLKKNNKELEYDINYLFKISKEGNVSKELFKSEMHKIIAKYRYAVNVEFVSHIGESSFRFYKHFVIAETDYRNYKKGNIVKLSIFQVFDKFECDERNRSYFKFNNKTIETDNYKTSFYSTVPEIKGEYIRVSFDSLKVSYPFYKKLN